ncbi:MAG: TraR/DksA family transcriptional regulator [Solirubrobacteraceae bacterium]
MDEARARKLLALARERVEKQIEELAPDADPTENPDLDQHLADYGTELFEKERDEGLADALREELGAIRRAEERLAQGTYGISVESGQPIPDARLEAIPWAERTVEEESRLPRGT